MELINKLLCIEYPVIQGGMAWIADADLATAVSEGGGLGVIAAGSAPGEMVREQIIRAKNKTNKPFGVNIALISPFAEDIVDVVTDEKVPVVFTGAGNPGKYMDRLKAAGCKVIPVIPSVALAKRMEGAGADAVICEGMESGGHIGESTTMSLLPQVVSAVEIPVIAAGGIGDGRGVAAAFMLGALGIQVGTRFLVADECNVSEAYKDQIIKAKDTSTVVTGRSVGRPVRVIKNRLMREMIDLEKEGIDVDSFEEKLSGSLRAAAMDGDMERGSIMSGQIAGMITKRQTAAEIIRELFEEASMIYEEKRGIMELWRRI